MPPNRFTFSTAGEPRFASPESHRRLPPSSTTVLFSTESIHRSYRDLIQSHQPLDYEHPEPPSRFLHRFVVIVSELHRSIRELIQQTKANKQRKPETKVISHPIQIETKPQTHKLIKSRQRGALTASSFQNHKPETTELKSFHLPESEGQTDERK